jgi:starch-binding outer membrane protein, SusD/RagB family
MMTRLASWTRAAGRVLLLGLVVSACSKDDILTPDTPDVIRPKDLETPEGRQAVYAGAVSDLVVASTSGLGVVIFSGLFTDELMHASTPPAVREWDLRGVLSTNSLATSAGGPFLSLQRARTALEGGARVLPANDPRTGELWALAGMTYIFFGELWCSGTPISERDPFQLGNPFSTTELFNRAVERLTTAAANTGGDARVQNLTAVLRGRALLNLGQFAQAASAVANVPTSFRYDFFHGAPPARQTNQIQLQTASDIYSVPNNEGGNGLDFASANDPRVPVQNTGVSRNDGVTPMVVARKYPAIDSPVAMVTGIEARLIEAEAALQASNPTLWLSKLNEARTTVTGLAPLADPGTQSARVDLTFRERAFWMYLTAHRLGDLRRLVRQYGRAKESVYPTGAYHKQGLTRGTQATLIVPQPEENNSNYSPANCTVETP